MSLTYKVNPMKRDCVSHLRLIRSAFTSNSNSNTRNAYCFTYNRLMNRNCFASSESQRFIILPTI